MPPKPATNQMAFAFAAPTITIMPVERGFL